MSTFTNCYPVSNFRPKAIKIRLYIYSISFFEGVDHASIINNEIWIGVMKTETKQLSNLYSI